MFRLQTVWRRKKSFALTRVEVSNVHYLMTYVPLEPKKSSFFTWNVLFEMTYVRLQVSLSFLSVSFSMFISLVLLNINYSSHLSVPKIKIILCCCFFFCYRWSFFVLSSLVLPWKYEHILKETERNKWKHLITEC